MSPQALLPLAELGGRILMGSLFMLEALTKLSAYQLASRYAEAFGVPEQILPFVIVLEFAGGALIAFGFQTRAVALVLAIFCVATAVIFHTNFADHNQLIHFEKNLALAGAFLVLSVRGAGRLSLDCIGRVEVPVDSWRRSGI